MSYNLTIDTSSEYFSATLSVSETIHGYIKSDKTNSHSESGPELLLELLKKHNLKTSDIDVVSIMIGPGSNTGIRVGISIVGALKIENPHLRIVKLSGMDLIFCAVKKQVENFDYIINLSHMTFDKCHVEIVDKTNNQIISPKILKYLEIEPWLNDLSDQMIDFSTGIKVITGSGANKNFQLVSEIKLNACFKVLSYRTDARKMIRPMRIKIKNKIFNEVSELLPVSI